MTLYEIFQEEVIVPSRMNDFTERELDFLYPDYEVPVFPKGIFINRYGSFSAVKYIGKKKYYIQSSDDILEVILKLEDFCKQHKIKL